MADTSIGAGSRADAAIEIRLSRIQQLFDSLDPSPFHQRDLDDEAEAYIIDCVDEFLLQKVAADHPLAD